MGSGLLRSQMETLEEPSYGLHLDIAQSPEQLVERIKLNLMDEIAESGEEIIISFGKTGKKIAVLVPYDKYISDSPRPLGLLKGKAQCKIGDDFQITDEDLLLS